MHTFSGSVLVGLALALSGCTTDADRPALSDWQAGYESGDTGFTDTDASVDFGLVLPYDLAYEARLYDTATGGDCSIDVPADFTGYTDIECTYDVSELDLYGSGLSFELFVPANACDFLIYDFYIYEAWEVGQGPTEVSYTIDTDGNIIDPVNYQSAPYCPYNYQAIDEEYPNCCTGLYTLTVTNQLSGTVTQDTYSWDGNPSDCYDGAGFADPEFIADPNGFPMGRIVPLYGASYSKRFDWGEISDRYFSNIPLANYYDPADHDGAQPAGFTGDYSREFYSFRCYDSAEELLAKVDMVVREWNEESELLADGDPNTTGTEPVSGDPIDDRHDWATGTPGSDTYIRFND